MGFGYDLCFYFLQVDHFQFFYSLNVSEGGSLHNSIIKALRHWLVEGVCDPPFY
jgi:hypothetical protein